MPPNFKPLWEPGGACCDFAEKQHEAKLHGSQRVSELCPECKDKIEVWERKKVGAA